MAQKDEDYCSIGVDVGGTNSDAVVLVNSKQVLCWTKHKTTEDITTGVELVVKQTLDKVPQEYKKAPIKHISIGTTHFLNAVIQKRHLVPVTVVRLCGAASRAIPPFTDMPQSLKSVIQGHVFLVDGGFYVDGQPFCQVSADQILDVARQIKESSIRNVVVSGIYSPMNSEQEECVGNLLKETLPDLSVTLSHTIGHMGLLERENAAILNECLKPLCTRTLEGFRRAFSDLGLDCPMYLTQNDGTLVESGWCLSHPVCTFASGPTNSMRGAAFLTKSIESVSDAIVVDIGGTTTDVGQLVHGFPRQAANKVKIGGVYTNFRMPDLHSIGLGGGSYVDVVNKDMLSVGPLSVGRELEEKAQCFGGSVLTATDAAVKASICQQIGTHPVSTINVQTAQRVVLKIKQMLENAVDQIKISANDVPLIIVGGGGILVEKHTSIKGVSELFLPEHHEVANAVGAALAQVSGSFDQIVTNKTRGEALKWAKEKAVDAAVQAGAKRDSVQIVDVTEVPLSYLPGNSMRYSVKAVGDLDGGSSVRKLTTQTPTPTQNKIHDKEESIIEDEVVENLELGQFPFDDNGSQIWNLNLYDIEAISIGSGLLGCGGGGSPYLSKLRASKCLREGLSIQIIKPERLNGEDLVAPIAFMGAPTVLVEKLVSGQECTTALSYVEAKIGGLLCCEIGGMNAIEPLVVAAHLKVPVVDADGMGRAFPELQMFLPFQHGYCPFPSILADERGSAISLLKVHGGAKALEDIFRSHVVNFMGCSAALALNPLKAGLISTQCIENSYTRAWHIGHSILEARNSKQDPVEAVLKHIEGSKLVCVGKISDLRRETSGGFARGTMIIASFSDEANASVTVDFQNENLIVSQWLDGKTKGKVLSTTPHLIVIVESDTGLAVQTEELRYGLRVSVLVLPAPTKLLTPESLALVGPKAFGYQLDVV